MEPRRTMHLTGPAGQMAFCGLSAALAVVIMAVGTWIPAALLCCPVLASVLLIPVKQEYGTKLALCWYAAVSLLSLIFAADKEAALVFILVGYYPILKPRLDRIRSENLNWLAKLVLFQVILLVHWAALLLVFTTGDLEGGWAMTALLWLLANVTLIMYDLVLGKLTIIYHCRIRKRLFGR